MGHIFTLCHFLTHLCQNHTFWNVCVLFQTVFMYFLVSCLSCFDSLCFVSIIFKLEYFYCTTFPCHFWPNCCYIYSFFHFFYLTGTFFLCFFFLFFDTDLFNLPSPPFAHIDFHLPSSTALYAMYQTHTYACAPVAYSILSARSSESN